MQIFFEMLKKSMSLINLKFGKDSCYPVYCKTTVRLDILIRPCCTYPLLCKNTNPLCRF